MRELNWISGERPSADQSLVVKIRYKAKAVACHIIASAADQVEVVLDEPATGVTPGQGAVFYEDNVCIGGGLITAETGAEKVIATPRAAVDKGA
ncbi:MAG: aminomethyltransferase beta-barrel domain-containing protein [Candidatus Promineifilaceae bacterium]